MVYKILITNATGTMQFATHKVEIKDKVIQEIDGVDTIIEVGTGKYKNDVFSSDNKETVKNKYIELLDTYKKSQLNIVGEVNEEVIISVTLNDEQITPSI